jgi:hypothetical protein
MLWNPSKEHKDLKRQIDEEFANLDASDRDKVGKVTVVEAQLCAWVFESHCWALERDGKSAACEWCGEKVNNYAAALDRKIWLKTSKVCPKVMEYIEAWDVIRKKARLLIEEKGEASND